MNIVMTSLEEDIEELQQELFEARVKIDCLIAEKNEIEAKQYTLLEVVDKIRYSPQDRTFYFKMSEVEVASNKWEGIL